MEEGSWEVVIGSVVKVSGLQDPAKLAGKRPSLSYHPLFTMAATVLHPQGWQKSLDQPRGWSSVNQAILVK